MITRVVMRTVAASAAILTLGWASLAMIDDRPSLATSPQPVTVRLLGPASEILGMKVPVGLAELNGTALRVEEPADVTVRLPGGRTVQQRVKYVSVNVDHGVVVDVYLLPLPKSLPYPQAFAELRRILRDMRIEPDEQMRKQMAEWPDDSPGLSNGFYPRTFRAGMDINKDFGLLAKLRPASDGGWFLSLTFESGGDARRAVWDPTFKPAAKLPAEEKDKGANQGSGSK